MMIRKRENWQILWMVYPFSLLEVMFALTIVIIGVSAIFSLMPVGITGHRDAVHLTTVSDVAEELLNVTGYYLRTNWNFVNLIPNQPADIGNGSDNGVEPGATLDIGDAGSRWKPLSATLFPGIYFYDKNNDGAPYSSSDECVFRIFYQRQIPNPKKPSQPISVTDIDAVCRVWRTPVRGWVNEGASWNYKTIDYSRAVCLVVEVSWPATIRYKDRQKTYYTMEVIR